MKKIIYVCTIFIFFPCSVFACCEQQGGLMGTYTEEGYAICKDETIAYEKSCMQVKEPNKREIVRRGCMNKEATNYDPLAEVDDGSCNYNIYGCMDKNALNYNEKANLDDGSCVAKKPGCMDKKANNYDASANIEDKSCTYMAIIVQNQTLSFRTAYQFDHALQEGEERTIQKGENGVKKIKYKIVVDYYGKEIQKQKLDEKIVKKPKDQKIMIGTKNSMLDFTVLLYILNFILLCINIWYLCNHSKRPYILREIKLYSCTIWYEIPLKMLGYICYFLFSLVMIDFVNILIYEIKKRFS